MATNGEHRRVLRYEIPVDDHPYAIPQGRVLMAHPWRESQVVPAGRVELWVEVIVPDDFPSSGPAQDRLVQVFGTGHPLTDAGRWLASCLDGPLVWHVYEVTASEVQPEEAP